MQLHHITSLLHLIKERFYVIYTLCSVFKQVLLSILYIYRSFIFADTNSEEKTMKLETFWR